MAKLSETGVVNAETYAEIKEETTGGSLWAPAVYDVVVEAAYLRKTDKGAKMLELAFANADGDKLFYSTCTHSGDLKGNKETFGIHNLKHFLQAIHDEDPDVVEGPIKHKGDEIQALGFQVVGKKLKIGVIELETDYNGGTVKNDIKAFLDSAGKNSKGEDLADELAAKIDEKPRKVEKPKAGTAPAGQPGDTAAMANSGWGGAK